MEWTKINWEDGLWIDEALNKFEENPESSPAIWETLAIRAGVKLDKKGNMPKNWTWEDSYKIGLPKIEDIYFCYFKDEDCFCVCSYDSENTTPCFWNQDEIVFPNAWADLSKENPLGE